MEKSPYFFGLTSYEEENSIIVNTSDNFEGQRN
jgi:hypothetical protein